jgi:hypothetical protein
MPRRNENIAPDQFGKSENAETRYFTATGMKNYPALLGCAR